MLVADGMWTYKCGKLKIKGEYDQGTLLYMSIKLGKEKRLITKEDMEMAKMKRDIQQLERLVATFK